MTQREVATLKAGIWQYDGLVPMSVRILVQNWDYYWEEGYDPDPPDLNAVGQAYYVLYEERARSRTCHSLGEAVTLAEETVGPITWND